MYKVWESVKISLFPFHYYARFNVDGKQKKLKVSIPAVWDRRIWSVCACKFD